MEKTVYKVMRLESSYRDAVYHDTFCSLIRNPETELQYKIGVPIKNETPMFVFRYLEDAKEYAAGYHNVIVVECTTTSVMRSLQHRKILSVSQHFTKPFLKNFWKDWLKGDEQVYKADWYAFENDLQAYGVYNLTPKKILHFTGDFAFAVNDDATAIITKPDYVCYLQKTY